MDFGALPPEINSGRMYTGPGSDSMLVAAGAWDGLAAQSATVGQPMSAVTSALQSLAAPGAGDPPSLQTLLTSLLPLLIAADLFEVTGPASLPARNALIANTFGYGLAARGFQTGELPVPLVPGVLSPPVAGLGGAASAASTVTAGVGRAGLVGALSVPPSWAAATPVVRLAASVLQGTGPAAAPLVATVGQGNVFGQMALSSLAGGALGNTVPRAATGTGARVDIPNQGNSTDSKTSDKLKRVLAELSQKPESVQHWHTDKTHLEGLLEQLSTKPGVHAVHVSSRNKTNPPSPQPRWG